MLLLAGLAVLEIMLQLQGLSLAAVLPVYLIYTLIFLSQMLVLIGAWRTIGMDAFRERLMYIVGMGLALEHILQHEGDYRALLADGGLLPMGVAVMGMFAVPLVVPFFVLIRGAPGLARKAKRWL